jgi:hypothetical protein
MLTGGGEEWRSRDLAVEEERGDGEGPDRWRYTSFIAWHQRQLEGSRGSSGLAGGHGDSMVAASSSKTEPSRGMLSRMEIGLERFFSLKNGGIL